MTKFSIFYISTLNIQNNLCEVFCDTEIVLNKQNVFIYLFMFVLILIINN